MLLQNIQSSGIMHHKRNLSRKCAYIITDLTPPLYSVCLSQSNTWISNVTCICRGIFTLNDLRCEGTVPFVEVGGIVDHHHSFQNKMKILSPMDPLLSPHFTCFGNQRQSICPYDQQCATILTEVRLTWRETTID